MLRDSAAATVRSHPQAMPLAKITMTKSIHGFPFISSIGMGLRSAAFGAPELRYKLKTYV